MTNTNVIYSIKDQALCDFRFFAICFPMKVRTICTTRRAKLVIPVLWLAGYVVAIPRQINLVNHIGLATIFNVFLFVSKVISLRESREPNFILLQE